MTQQSTIVPAELAQHLTFRSKHAYGVALGEQARWEPVSAFVCGLYDIVPQEIALGEIGTYPTCLVDETYVVKLCGPWYGGYANAAAERAVFRALEALDDRRVPGLIHEGQLVGADGEIWHYLVSAFKPGKPIIALRGELDQAALSGVASELGTLMRHVHARGAAVDGEMPRQRREFASWVQSQHRNLVARLTGRGSLPERWVSQMPDYVMSPEQLLSGDLGSLLHCDVTADHILIDGSGATGLTWSLIDWGDARLGDRYYELAALYLDAFGGQRDLLGAFLEAYGWSWDERAARRAMTYLLLHEFDVLGPFVADHPDLLKIETLQEFAQAIWET